MPRAFRLTPSKPMLIFTYNISIIYDSKAVCQGGGARRVKLMRNRRGGYYPPACLPQRGRWLCRKAKTDEVFRLAISTVGRGLGPAVFQWFASFCTASDSRRGGYYPPALLIVRTFGNGTPRTAFPTVAFPPRYAARRCDLSCENLCGAAGAAVRSSAPSSVSMASCETHFARLCREPPPDGGASFAGANARGRSPLSLAVTTVSFRRKRWG